MEARNGLLPLHPIQPFNVLVKLTRLTPLLFPLNLFNCADLQLCGSRPSSSRSIRANNRMLASEAQLRVRVLKLAPFQLASPRLSLPLPRGFYPSSATLTPLTAQKVVEETKNTVGEGKEKEEAENKKGKQEPKEKKLKQKHKTESKKEKSKKTEESVSEEGKKTAVAKETVDEKKKMKKEERNHDGDRTMGEAKEGARELVDEEGQKSEKRARRET
ncbi:hypothetical protein FN846DRAFT_997336 [Sphaerosporella brunnea]|uniref:Uncharacterized protein n=1 Tax=Sphaerosporella brunnea TaxID=1250544 RepID=A0A5J5EKL8_9PEZI|nr:hypothetical protein FN846DRAFT_997336 [Sphaerosporella brunnea]